MKNTEITKIPAIMIARGGSVRIPGKNLYKIAGKPIIEWKLLQTTCSHYTSNTYLVTDDDEIASYGEKYGAEIVWQDVQFTQYGRMGGTLATVAGILAAQKKEEFDASTNALGCCILNYPEDIDRVIKKHQSGRNYQTVLMAEMHEPVLYTRTLDDYAKIIPKESPAYSEINDDYEKFKSDKPIMMICHGAIVTEVEANLDAEIREREAFAHMAYVMGQPWQYFDLNEVEDIDVFEALFQTQILDKRGVDCYERYKAKQAS